MAFYVGQKVVCVDAISPVIRGRQSELSQIKEGSEYTITNFRIDPQTGLPAVQIGAIYDEWTWLQARRFRPLVEKKSTTETGMAILREILERETIENHGEKHVRKTARTEG